MIATMTSERHRAPFSKSMHIDKPCSPEVHCSEIEGQAGNLASRLTGVALVGVYFSWDLLS
jgi:hypothetical protein